MIIKKEMERALIVFIFISIFFTCCVKSQQKDTENYRDLSSSEENEICISVDSFPKETQIELVKYLKLQSNSEKDDNKENYKMTTKDIEIASNLLYKVLVKNGFNPTGRTEFGKILEQKMGITSDQRCGNIIYHDHFFTYLMSQGGDMDYLQDTEFDYTYQHLYFILEYGFITELPLLGDLIGSNEINRDSKVCVSENFIYRNKFLFNDSKSSLTWLINNDLEFLEILVKEFGYDKDNKVNEAVLENINKKYLGKEPYYTYVLFDLFAKKRVDGKLDIREGLMKFVSDNCNMQFQTPLDMLNRYAGILIYGSDEYSETDNLTQEERFKIAAYAGYYEQLARDRNNIDSPDNPNYTPEGWNPGSSLLNNINYDENFLKNIEKNNYYNLPGFEDMVSNILGIIERQSKEYDRTHS